MNVKRKGMTPKNEALSTRFYNLSEDVQLNALNLKNVSDTSRFKNMSTTDIVKQVWTGKSNSEKRHILKTVNA